MAQLRQIRNHPRLSSRVVQVIRDDGRTVCVQYYRMFNRKGRQNLQTLWVSRDYLENAPEDAYADGYRQTG